MPIYAGKTMHMQKMGCVSTSAPSSVMMWALPITRQVNEFSHTISQLWFQGIEHIELIDVLNTIQLMGVNVDFDMSVML